MMRELQTARLVLRPLQLSDAAQVQALFPHWEIVQYLVRTRSEVIRANWLLVGIADFEYSGLRRKTQ